MVKGPKESFQAKSAIRLALVIGAILSLSGTFGAIMMFGSSPYSWSSYLGGILAALSVPGAIFGTYLTAILTGSPHGGTGKAILLVATPFNFIFYTLVSLGLIRMVTRFRRGPHASGSA